MRWSGKGASTLYLGYMDLWATLGATCCLNFLHYQKLGHPTYMVRGWCTYAQNLFLMNVGFSHVLALGGYQF
jgi:hypothetical protein